MEINSTSQFKDDSDFEIIVLAYTRKEETLEIVRISERYTKFPITVFIDGPRDTFASTTQLELIRRLHKEHPQVKTILDTKNQGCRKAVMTALNKLPEYSNAGNFIILEDDCIPSEAFFNLIIENTDNLKNNLISICGKSPIVLEPSSGTVRSNYPLIHGWAISRKRLKEQLTIVNEGKFSRPTKKIPWPARLFWKLTCCKVDVGNLDTWDAHWMIASWQMRGQHLIPATPLIRNVGAVSTREERSPSNLLNRKRMPKQNSMPHSQEDHDKALLKFFFGISWTQTINWSLQLIVLKALIVWKSLKGKLSDDV